MADPLPPPDGLSKRGSSSTGCVLRASLFTHRPLVEVPLGISSGLVGDWTKPFRGRLGRRHRPQSPIMGQLQRHRLKLSWVDGSPALRQLVRTGGNPDVLRESGECSVHACKNTVCLYSIQGLVAAGRAINQTELVVMNQPGALGNFMPPLKATARPLFALGKDWRLER